MDYDEIKEAALCYLVQHPWLNTKQAAAYLGVGTGKIRFLSLNGHIDRCYVDEGARRPRFHINDLDNYMRRPARL